MKRIRPCEALRNTPCSIVAVACALGQDGADRGIELKNDGYATLASMNKYVRQHLRVKRQVKYRRGERPKLRDLKLGKAVVCVLGHYVYLDGDTYYSFFKNSGDDVVCVWELEG